MTGGSASALELSRPARASLLLRPIGSLSGPRPPSSQGSGTASYPAVPPARFRTHRQLSGREPPSLIVRALGAHGHSRRFDDWPITSGVPQLTDISTVSRYVSNVPIAKCPPVASAAPGGHGGVSAVLAQRLPTR